ncbi:hypothetical protein [Novosphingobium sp.]|uniref:hypothetical protein n=1 Tax=Novosphingobium sp. TaxID=1874826 RepID=UPI002B494C2D|nr:hypothetical protein [Novosphingobium sp.]HKR91434.1 hypothetical protein [Novosphingobium sp.]
MSSIFKASRAGIAARRSALFPCKAPSNLLEYALNMGECKMSDAMPVTQVELFPQPQRNNTISDELGNLLDLLRSEFSNAHAVHFEFDGKLKLHVDVRNSEEIAATEAKLAMLCAGIFINIHHGATPHHPFFHRVTAEVIR